MLKIVPITFRAASAFTAKHHRHNKPPRGCKFCIGVVNYRDILVGVAQCGRPVARHLDDGLTLEINRTTTRGWRNANSKLYGASRQIAKAMGYRRVITYTQLRETGASLKAAGFIRVKNLPARGTWAESSGNKWNRKANRDVKAKTGDKARVLWHVEFGNGATT